MCEENNQNNNKEKKDIENKGVDEMAEKKPVSKHYKTKRGAEKRRRSGERIYHEAGRGYYIRRPRTIKSHSKSGKVSKSKIRKAVKKVKRKRR